MAIALLSASDSNLLVENPTWAQVETAICSLNDADRNDVYLHPDRNDMETYLAVGGGNGQYVVIGAQNNTSFPALVPGDGPDDRTVELTVGGQPGEYPASWIADLAPALEAARAFYDAGGFASNHEWTNV